MQEYRADVETFPGAVASIELLDVLHSAMEQVGTGFLNNSALEWNEETNAATFQLWLDAPSPLTALGTACNIIDRAMHHIARGHLPAVWAYRMNCEVTDFMAHQTPWPTMAEEPQRIYQEAS